MQFLHESAANVAPRLLGCILERRIDGAMVRAKIVETEAYDENDIASHSFKGKTPRTEVMFGPPGHLYVYFTYGMHYCCNIVVGPEGRGSAVLIRAVEPIEGVDIMQNKRKKTGVLLTNGPAKLCQAMGIDLLLNGHDLRKDNLRLIVKGAIPAASIVQSTRVGISVGIEMPWRFYIKDNPYVSRYKN